MFHRATKITLRIHWVAILPVVPYLIDHLSSCAQTSVQYSSNRVPVVTYGMMHKEKWICTSIGDVDAGEKLLVWMDAPFGDHVGPGVQFDGAPLGHAPRRSLKAAKGKKY